MITKHLAIMLTDIKGFTTRTSLSSRSETLELLDKHKKLVLPVLEKYSGHIVKTIGDAFLVTFESPTNAVLCGVAIQDALKEYNSQIAQSEKIEIRIAINSGEVALSDNDIFGEAVNITSRLESIAEAGQVFFTEAIYLAMNKKEVPSSEIGYRQFKGVPEKIKVYRVLRETPIGKQLMESSNSNEKNEGDTSTAELKPAKFKTRLLAIILDVIFFFMILNALKITSCSPDVKYRKPDNTPGKIKAENIILNKDKIEIKGENGEEVTISKKDGIKVVTEKGELLNISKNKTPLERKIEIDSKSKSNTLKMLLWVLYCGILVWRFGATPGKMIMKIRVVDFINKEKPAADKSFLRAFFSLVSLFLFLGYIWAKKEKDNRTWHDLIAGTYVVEN